MAGVTLDTAKNVALLVAIVAAGVAVVAALVVKAVVSKVLSVVLLALLAFAVWSQRTSLQECADRVRADRATDPLAQSTCEFFGQDVTVPR